MNKFWSSFVYGSALTAVTYAIGAVLGFFNPENFGWIEFFAIWTSYICTLLCVYQKRINYPIGAVSTVLYAILSYKADLPALGLFNILLSVNLIYGWFRWNSDAQTRPVESWPSLPWWIGYAAIAIVAYFLLTTISSYFGYQVTWLDVTTAVVYAVAQAMLDNKHRSAWGVFAVLNVLSIYVYFQKPETYFVALQYLYFLGNAAYGHFEWRKTQLA